MFLTVRSCLSTSRNHHRAGLDVLRDLFTGNTWLPARLSQALAEDRGLNPLI